MDGWYRTREQSGVRNCQLKCCWVSSGSLWEVKGGKTRHKTGILLVGQSSNTWDAPSEASLLFPVALTVSWVKLSSVCQEPVLLISEQHCVPVSLCRRGCLSHWCLLAVIPYGEMCSHGQCPWGSAEGRQEKGNEKHCSMLKGVWDVLRNCGR